jgi:taurine dioxygenase
MDELEFKDLTPAFGAEVVGLVPKTPLDEDVCRQLRQVFYERGLLVLRGLDIDESFQRYFAYMLIDQEPPGVTPAGDGAPTRGTMFVSNKEPGGGAPYGRLLFHCDTMWSETPYQALSLYAVDVEQPSAPTLFASMAHGWDTLAADLKARVADMNAVQGHTEVYANRGADEDVIDSVFEAPVTITTPVAKRHPRTGRTLLYVSQQVTLELAGLDPDENEDLLEKLFAHLYDPEHVYQHDWRNGDLVIWDNQAVQHARPNVVLEGPTRTLRKVFAPPLEAVAQGVVPRFSKVS